MTYVKLDVPKSTTQNVGRGGDKKDILTIFDWDDVLLKTRVDNNCSGIAMNASKYMLKVYAKMDSIKVSADAAGEFDTIGIIQGIDFIIPGGLTAVRDFRSNWTNRKVGIIVEKTSDGSKLLYGDDGAPLMLTFKEEWDKDKNVSTMTFKSVVDGLEVADYTGSYTYSTVTGTFAANAATLDFALANGGTYQLTTGTASIIPITAFNNPVDGAVYTLLGSGGTYPSSIATSANILLKIGTSWNALAGSQISFKCFRDGASSYKFYEIARV